MCLAVPGRLCGIERADDPLERRGSVDFGGVRRKVSLAFVPDAVVGDHLLIHAGVALARLDASAAAQVRELLDEASSRDPSP